ncbi:FAD-dependent monooxygenase [Gordonia sp. NPDC058843]|uniref:FAD-dependent monooxygenase n=1 Tax=Gordonia sp. NPDC058843 TaxID=3346648 RepID=UPI0036C7EC2F
MSTALFIATVLCIVANAGIAIADFAKAELVLHNSAEVHVAPRALPYLATAKAAGAVGLLIGLTAEPWIGVAAGIVLTLHRCRLRPHTGPERIKPPRGETQHGYRLICPGDHPMDGEFAMSERTEEYDAVIVGARCAGAATAIALAGRGLRVLVIDSARFPSDTLSTHLLWPSTMAEIHALGALPAVEDAGAPRLPTAEAVLDEIAWRTPYSPVSGIDYAMCLRRSHLDAALQRTAVTAGADLRQLCRATSLIWADGRAAGVVYVDEDEREHRAVAPVVIGADGRKSMVAREANAQIPLISSPSGRSCYFAYWTDPRNDQRHIASQWRVDGLLGTAFPCDGGHTLCLLQPPIDLDEEFRGRKVTDAYLAGIAAIPGLARRLDGAEMTSRVRSCTGIESYFRRSSGPGWALPGDAGHFKDPVTAQGIRDAYRYGRLLGEELAPVLRGGDPDPDAVDTATAAWARRRERECVEIYQWTNFLASGTPPSPLEYEVNRRARDRAGYAATLGDIYNRTQPPSAMLPMTALPGLVYNATRRASLRKVAADLRTQSQRLRSDRRERRTLERISPSAPTTTGSSRRIPWAAVR